MQTADILQPILDHHSQLAEQSQTVWMEAVHCRAQTLCIYAAECCVTDVAKWNQHCQSQ